MTKPLHSCEDWLAVNKPTNISTHGAFSGDLGVVEWLQLHHEQRVHVCSRLDKGTSGVLLLAKTAAASARAQAIHETDAASKTYIFVSKHRPPQGQKKWICESSLDGKPCQTRFEHISSTALWTFFRATLSRGRKHQIRRHAAESGVPILGDIEYGRDDFHRLCLHCESVTWPEIHEIITAPWPSSFLALAAEKTEPEVGLAVADDRRLDWLSSVSSASRVIHRNEVPQWPAAVEIFGDWFCITGFSEEISARDLWEEMESRLHPWLTLRGCRGGVCRTNRRNPHNNRLTADAWMIGEPPPDLFWIQEQGISFPISLTHTQHTGLFLDQRDTRQRIRRAASGARLANLFSFTCSFSAAALAGGAEVAFSVDVAKGSLDRGKQTLAENKLDLDRRGKFVVEDVRDWISRSLRRKNERPQDFLPFDLIVCDPPVFASGYRGKHFSVEEEWSGLVRGSAQLLCPTGQVLLANNHRGGAEAPYRNEVLNNFQNVEILRPPLDFPELPGEPVHVRIYWCTFPRQS